MSPSLLVPGNVGTIMQSAQEQAEAFAAAYARKHKNFVANEFRWAFNGWLRCRHFAYDDNDTIDLVAAARHAVAVYAHQRSFRLYKLPLVAAMGS